MLSGKCKVSTILLSVVVFNLFVDHLIGVTIILRNNLPRETL